MKITIVNLHNELVRRDDIRPLRYFSMYGLRFMAHRDECEGGFGVSEHDSGAITGSGCSIKSAWGDARRRLRIHGKAKTLSKVAEWIREFGRAN